MSVTLERVATGFGLIEGPVWDPARGLYFSDALNGGVHLLDRAGQILPVIPKRRGIGGMALHASSGAPGSTIDGLVVGGRDIACVSLADGATHTLLSTAAIPGALGFNDFTTDRMGRIYAGSVRFRVFAGDKPVPGHLHVIDLDGTMRTISDGIMLTNGIAFSGDGRLLYHADARGDLIRVYEVQGDGSVGPWRTFATFGKDGTPDGLKVARDGSVWVAQAHAGKVAVFEADGRLRRSIAIPLPLVTSLCFGGDDLRDLYIVTGSHGGPHENCGSIFRLGVDVPGVPMWPARVALPTPGHV